jgi:hypothetical protein
MANLRFWEARSFLSMKQRDTGKGAEAHFTPAARSLSSPSATCILALAFWT